MKCTQVAVLRGGPSTEYDVSLRTGLGVLSALSDELCNVIDIVISKKGEWTVDGFVKSPEQALVGVDVVFIALHGAYGEDGTVQRILDRLNIPYTGSGAYSSAIAMNKVLTKDSLKDSGIKMAKHAKVTKEAVTNFRQTAENIEKMFGPAYIVKPLCGGSSLHTEVADGFVELSRVLEKVLAEVEAVIVEERISGREATVAILDNYRDQLHYPMPVIEIIPPQKSTFFSADVKYTGETDEICPGRFSAEQRDVLTESALKAHKLLGLRHYSRSDFMVSENGIYFLEVNTLPGLTSESLFPKAINAVGGSYKELILHLVNLAHNDIEYE